MIRHFKIVDWLVVAAAIIVAVTTSALLALLAAIALLLYLLLRHASGAFRPRTMNEAPELAGTFIVHESTEHGFVDTQEIELDRDINDLPSKGRFRWYSRFDLGLGRADYEYKCEGTKVLIRLLNQLDEGESAGFKQEWEVRDGVVLESDLRARDSAKQFRIRNVDEEIANLRKQIEWQELQPAWFNGFKYFLVRRCLPPDEARRYLRQEIERLKMGNARVLPVAARYGLEPDSDPKSIGGWKDIPGQEKIDTKPFWEQVEAGAFGISSMECGSFGMKLVSDLHKLLGDSAEA